MQPQDEHCFNLNPLSGRLGLRGLWPMADGGRLGRVSRGVLAAEDKGPLQSTHAPALGPHRVSALSRTGPVPGVRVRTVWRNAIQPRFAPERIRASRAEHTACPVPPLANNRFEYYARRPQLKHTAGFFADDLLYSTKHAIGSVHIGHLLRIEIQAPVLPRRVQCSFNLLERTHTHKFSRAEIQVGNWCSLPSRNGSQSEGKRTSSPDEVETIVEPAYSGSKSNSGSGQIKAQGIRSAANDMSQSHIA
jgi:hypothetical protein